MIHIFYLRRLCFDVIWFLLLEFAAILLNLGPNFLPNIIQSTLWKRLHLIICVIYLFLLVQIFCYRFVQTKMLNQIDICPENEIWAVQLVNILK